MEGLILPFLVAALALVLGSILGFLAFFRVLRCVSDIARQRTQLDEALRRLARLEGLVEKAPEEERPVVAPAPKAPSAAAAPPSPIQPLAPSAAPEEAAVPPAVEKRPEVKAPAPRPAAFPPRPGPPPPAEGLGDMEEMLGKRWMAWAGAVALFLATGFFVKYAFDQGWIGPTARVVAGVVFGIVLLVVGDLCIRRRMPALGQGLIGGGLAILYVSLFAAFSLYHLIPQEAALAAMIVATASGMALSVLHNALPMSLLAALGGLLTPVLCATGEDARDGLFTYLVLLDLGVLCIGLFRRWRVLDALIFVGTWALYTGWYSQFYTERAFVPAMLWAGGFYLVFLLPSVFQLRARAALPLERFLMELANATVFLVFSYLMLHAGHRYILGFIALGMAACYTALAAGTRRRIPADGKSLLGFAALAALCLTLAVPLHLKFQGILVAWATEAVVLLYLGYKFQYWPVRLGAFIVLALAVIRLFASHWPLHEALFVPLWNRHFGTAMWVPLAGAAFAFVHHHWKEGASRADLPFKLAAAIASWLLATVILQAEIGQYLIFRGREYAFDGRYYAHCMQVGFWSLAAAGLLAGGVRARSLSARLAGLLPLGTAAVLGLLLYGHGMNRDYVLLFNLRFAAALLISLTVFAFAYVPRRFQEVCAGWEQGLAIAMYALGGLLLLAILSLEAFTYCVEAVPESERARWTALMAISLVWGLYAAGALALGFWRRVRALRLCALGLFALTVAKLVLVDLAGIKQLYRIIAFLVLGLLMMGASYLYHRAEKRFMKSEGEKR
jgi:uncharacterized membrane protein